MTISPFLVWKEREAQWVHWHAIQRQMDPEGPSVSEESILNYVNFEGLGVQWRCSAVYIKVQLTNVVW